ncbi:hypothetical protein [Rubinisphaera italica]|uniref:hypothetical protein n=1 Tax=Rubinisphaera italica TaxID=2527969 RepID=UPI0011B469D3|nr:hypothetical protein [Rubinisphaera italica]
MCKRFITFLATDFLPARSPRSTRIRKLSERTRDKMAAARRKGRNIGGAPVLGYDVDREKSRLTVIEPEAEQDRL